MSPVSEAPAGDPAETVPAEAAPESVDAELPAETAALVDSVEPNGLYEPPRGDIRLVVISDLNSAYGSTDYD
ncbi:MAG: metallophosphoesterase, partial [Cyanobacteria bacterium J06638_22]